uniref:Uncharacterized protein n=1 Tax=Neogobius melanostomus TaxID=47308 RepID=A0A8C6SS65_9GOBI
MEGDFDSGQENANFVLDEEYSELLHILNNQPSTVIQRLCAMVPGDKAGQIGNFNPTSFSTTVKALMDFYSQADSSLCRGFLQCICLLCENIPMWLETRLMSVSGNPTSKFKDWQIKRWGAARKGLVMDVELDNVWVNVRRANKTREQTDQTPSACSRTKVQANVLVKAHFTLKDKENAILDYLLSNPEQSCWVLDGYDEFQCNMDERNCNNAQLDLRSPRPVADLISGLLKRHILPGCTVIFTCRLHDVTVFEGQADRIGLLQHWNHHEIKKYVDKYFELKGNHATKLLFSNKQLVAMSSNPALCNISCIYLKKHKEDVLSVPQMPSALSQIYLMSIGAFLSRCSEQEHLSTPVDLSQRSSELTDLCTLAWQGLEARKILFLEEEIPYNIVDFSVNTGFISKVNILQRGILVNAYYFIHITVQEFLSALKIMTSKDDNELKNRLRTRWASKSDQGTLFTNSLHLFLSGLASPCCLAILTLLTKADQNVVLKRQETVKKWIQNMCHAPLTGPKVLELCHCFQEFQDNNLSKQLMRAKPKLELHNMTLSPNDLDALAFVLNSNEENITGLDFQGCSIALDSLELLSQCNTINDLSFHSRKYGDSFAEKLITVLPKLNSLEKFSFCDASLTAIGAAHLASALQECPRITEINLSGNNLRDEGTKHITDIVSKLPRLSSINLGQNNTTLQAAVCLIKEISSLNIQHIDIE